MRGLIEAVDDAKGRTSLKRDSIEIEPIKKYDSQKIKGIRSSVGMSQKLFAGYLGVSQKTVEAWESGKNIPNGTASRLLQILEQNPNLINQYQFVKMHLES
jgi:putative transcriptional regulator